jgi:hypothetical protein
MKFYRFKDKWYIPFSKRIYNYDFNIEIDYRIFGILIYRIKVPEHIFKTLK